MLYVRRVLSAFLCVEWCSSLVLAVSCLLNATANHHARLAEARWLLYVTLGVVSKDCVL